MPVDDFSLPCNESCPVKVIFGLHERQVMGEPTSPVETSEKFVTFEVDDLADPSTDKHCGPSSQGAFVVW
jgi:hypothetical protein